MTDNVELTRIHACLISILIITIKIRTTTTTAITVIDGGSSDVVVADG